MAIIDREQGVKDSRTFKNIRTLYGLSGKSVIDIGCGFGEYLRFFGTGSVGITTSQEEVKYGKENNLNIIFNNAEKLEEFSPEEEFDAIWANNLFEHLLSPHSFLMKIKKITHSRTILILGVPVIPRIAILTSLKKFRGALDSSHINFFTQTTLRLTAERAGWKVLAVRPFIFKNMLFDALVSPIAPHLYVMAENMENFIYPSKKVREWKDDEHYSELLSLANSKEEGK